MKKVNLSLLLAGFVLIFSFLISCKKEEAPVPSNPHYSNLSLEDIPFGNVDIEVAKELTKKLFQMKKDGVLTELEISSLGNRDFNLNLQAAFAIVNRFEEDQVFYDIENISAGSIEDRGNYYRYKKIYPAQTAWSWLNLCTQTKCKKSSFEVLSTLPCSTIIWSNTNVWRCTPDCY